MMYTLLGDCEVTFPLCNLRKRVTAPVPSSFSSSALEEEEEEEDDDEVTLLLRLLTL